MEGYDQEERDQIAQEIIAYMRTNKIETTATIEGVLVTKTIDAEPYHQALLELTALDVLGKIDHTGHPSRLRQGTRYTRHHATPPQT